MIRIVLKDSEISKLSISLQEDMIIEDLLNCMSVCDTNKDDIFYPIELKFILLKGIEGKYIRTPCLIDRHAERAFHVDRLLDPAMRELAKRILPVCSNYSLIIRFVEGLFIFIKITQYLSIIYLFIYLSLFFFKEKSHFKWGLVNHALCSAIKELLKVG